MWGLLVVVICKVLLKFVQVFSPQISRGENLEVIEILEMYTWQQVCLESTHVIYKLQSTSLCGLIIVINFSHVLVILIFFFFI